MGRKGGNLISFAKQKVENGYISLLWFSFLNIKIPERFDFLFPC